LIRKGKRSAQLLTKARILLKADVSELGEGWSDSPPPRRKRGALTKGAVSAKSRPFVFMRLKNSAEDQFYFCAVCCRPIILNCAFCSSLSEV
jgi:hypothetical protein